MAWFYKRGVTLIELIVALVIIAILSATAVGVYTKQVLRAKFARARQEIRTLELACHRYEVDLGEFPPSGSFGGIEGSGFLQLTLIHSANGSALAPAESRWGGPYVEFDENQMGDITGNPVNPGLNIADIQLLDPWDTPYQYVRSSDYSVFMGTELSVDNPFSATETYYNPTTFQIISYGPNRQTLPPPDRGIPVPGQPSEDDISNFIGSDL